MSIRLRMCVLMILLAGGERDLVAGPDEASLLQAWCRPFVDVAGVDAEWRYETVGPPDAEVPPPFRERVVCCWHSGLLIESGGGIRRRPGDGVGPSDSAFAAAVTVVTPTRDRTSLRWTPGHLAKPALDRQPVDFVSDLKMKLPLSEYLIANHLVSELPGAVLQSATWAGSGEDITLELSTEMYDFAWERDGESLRFVSLVWKRPGGTVGFRQEFDDHIDAPMLNGKIASVRRTFMPEGDETVAYQLVNTAVLEDVKFLASVPEGFTELDTSEATVADLKRGVVYDDAGNEVGNIIKPGVGAPRNGMPLLFGIAGGVIALAGAIWWWMRRRTV